MKSTTAYSEESLTPEITLAILRDSYIQQCQYDPEAEPDMDLSFNSTIEDWRYACDLVAWKPLGRAMNEWFKVQYSDEQWHEVLEPAESKKLLGVCELISSTATRPSVIPLNIFGNRCLEAGAFVTLRAALASAGIPVDSLRPSTPLHPWVLEYWGGFSDVVGKIAPEVLPPVKIEEPRIQKFSYRLFAFGIITWLVSLFVAQEVVSLIAVTSMICGLVLILFTSRLGPQKVSFGKLETIGDVCRLISASVKSGCSA
ncbi:hypothetical protein [uncultured Desulfuromonas sp.]|uniref:hypothetical protein n=1 Tax=uncultured Desulfuromonas sp. TaxID=181013 RepID=UPI002AAC1B0D|nr:hypothetical protein [uncultured Desulfuromonas sp.]